MQSSGSDTGSTEHVATGFETQLPIVLQVYALLSSLNPKVFDNTSHFFV
jgi:hypothetical protein